MNQAIWDARIMKKDVLTTHVRDLLTSAGRHLSDFASNRQSESLHRLRVDLKKIKAAHAFAEYAFDRKFPSAKLKPLFKEAGAIREIQVHLSMLKQFPHPPKRLIAQLERSEKTLADSFIRNLSVHQSSLNDFQKKCGLLKEKIGFKTITKYFTDMQEAILKHDDADGMHLYRIRIKRMMHVYHMLPEKIQRRTNLDIESIEELQQELGDWHDLHTAIHFLSAETIPKRAAEHISDLKNMESTLFNRLLGILS